MTHHIRSASHVPLLVNSKRATAIISYIRYILIYILWSFLPPCCTEFPHLPRTLYHLYMSPFCTEFTRLKRVVRLACCLLTHIAPISITIEPYLDESERAWPWYDGWPDSVPMGPRVMRLLVLLGVLILVLCVSPFLWVRLYVIPLWTFDG